MNFQQKIAVAVVDVVILVELCISIYLANLDPENLTPRFLKYFFVMLIPTLVFGRIAIKRLKSKEQEPTT